MSTTKNLIIEALITSCELEMEVMDDADDEEQQEILDNLFEDIITVSSVRYLQKSGPVPKSLSWITNILPNLDEKRFRSMIRMTRKQFMVILTLLEDDPAFYTTKKQLPVAVQLAVVLFRLGSYGSGCSLSKVATLFGIGDGGTIHRVTTRVFKVILSLQNQIIYWPTPAEREVISDDVGENFPKCVGFLDGSEFNLAEAPCLDHTSYYSRKQRYSIKAQAVCDYSLRIRHIFVGYPGSAHDARIFNNSDLGRNPKKYFSGTEWLAADSAYRLTATVITPFRKNSTFKTKKERDKFNKYFSGYRVKIEQCFGILKEKFSSLKELNIRIKDAKSHEFACAWIRVCAILHNKLRPYYDDEDLAYEHEEVNEDDEGGSDENSGSDKRAALFSILEPKL